AWADAPQFAEEPSFEPMVTFLTWQRDPTTTMTIQWIGTPEEGASRKIWHSKAGSMEWHETVHTGKPYPKTNYQIFRTELTGLEPGAEYRFRVGLDSKEKKFRTMPAKATNTIEFVSGGDAGINQAAQDINRVAAGQDPMFVVMG